jgi:predicted lipoprotein with Yx(FWY)xxD motif
MHHPLPLVVAATLALAVAAAASAARPERLVATATNAKLHETVLVTTAQRTLYTLSAERRGRFVCVKGCLSFWTPLTVAAGRTPSGAAGLGAVTRPGGTRQVTFRGLPLYTFNGDHRRGDANGEGVKDVGVWHAASPSHAQPQPAPAPAGYGYGG